MLGTNAINGTGNGLPNLIAGNDTLDGGAGNGGADTLDGRVGANGSNFTNVFTLTGVTTTVDDPAASGNLVLD